MPGGRCENCAWVGADGAVMFGVGTTEGKVVGGTSGGPIGACAGAKGATVVVMEGAGAKAGLGGTIGMPGESGTATG